MAVGDGEQDRAADSVIISPPGSFRAGTLPLGLSARNSGAFCSLLLRETRWNSYGAPASASAASAANAPERRSP